jgi:putative spermidine/putrescine transport system ATP-binding protein
MSTAKDSVQNQTAGLKPVARPIEDTHPEAAAMGSGLDLRGLTKVFSGRHGEQVVAVDDIDLKIEHGEYVVLLGPSGCGKTTTLRMIGGHEDPTSGEILLDGENLAGLPPNKRPTTTVFQHFALFPHKTVLANVEFGPKMHGVSKEERHERAIEALQVVGLSEFADRKPAALSGGQQQRVALARVLVTEPKALLLDEPLGDLDRLLRLKMRVELRNLQRDTGLMFIHVTHDQEESLSVADRIVVMSEGKIAQIGDPLTISTKPETEVVAAFMGDNNIFRGTVARRDGDHVEIEGEDKVTIRVPSNEPGLEVGTPASVSVGAGAMKVSFDDPSSSGVNALDCLISAVEYLGDLIKLHLESDGKPLLAKVAAERYPEFIRAEGARIRASWSAEDVRLLRT